MSELLSFRSRDLGTRRSVSGYLQKLRSRTSAVMHVLCRTAEVLGKS